MTSQQTIHAGNQIRNQAVVIHVVLLLILFLATRYHAEAQGTPDPGLLGTHTVIKAEYNLGDLSYTPPAAAMFPSNMEERGCVHYPSDLASGPFPVLIWLHGQHDVCYEISNDSSFTSVWPCPAGSAPITSYEGYDYASQVIASHGYVVISISANAINTLSNSLPDYAMNARGVLMQHHLDLWNGWNTTDTTGPFGHTFVGRLNMKKVGTMGHSRGGEGAIYNANYNASLGSPYGIKAVLTLAPVDFYRHYINGIPLLDISPYCDGDVSDLEGVHYFDDTRYNVPTDVAPKHHILFMGANHDFFNTVWTPGSYVAGGADDWADYGWNPFDPHCGTSAPSRFDTTKEKAAYITYASAFYRLYLGQETQFAPILEVNDIVPPASSTLDSADVYVTYHAGYEDRLDVNRTNAAACETTNTLTGSVTETGIVGPEICGGGLTLPVCDGGLVNNQKPHRGTTTLAGLAQMKLTWSDTTQSYENDVPATNQDVSSYQALTFRSCVNFPETTSGIDNDFTVQLIDSAGNTASQAVSSHSHALFYEPGTQANDLPKLVFNTIRIPLNSFTSVNLSKIRHIRFKFNKSATGAVLISDLAFSNPVCGNLSAAFTDSIGKRYKTFFTNKTAYTSGDSLAYLWNFGDAASGVLDTSTAVNPTHIYPTHNSYTVCLYVKDFRKNGLTCTDTLCQSVVLANDAIPELAPGNIQIIPNPAKDHIQITGTGPDDQLVLVNLYGQVVLKTTMTQPDVALPAAIPSGVYSAVITTANGRTVLKLVINH